MSFNDEQRDYMRELGALRPEQLCYCGWYRFGQCSRCPKGKTAQDKLNERTPPAAAAGRGEG